MEPVVFDACEEYPFVELSSTPRSLSFLYHTHAARLVMELSQCVRLRVAHGRGEHCRQPKARVCIGGPKLARAGTRCLALVSRQMTRRFECCTESLRSGLRLNLNRHKWRQRRDLEKPVGNTAAPRLTTLCSDLVARAVERPCYEYVGPQRFDHPKSHGFTLLHDVERNQPADAHGNVGPRLGEGQVWQGNW